MPSGVVVAKLTASSKYRQYVDGVGSTGVETALGHLFTTVDLGGTTSTVVEDVTAALFWGPGEVIEANLPTNHGLDANGKTDLKLIRYV